MEKKILVGLPGFREDCKQAVELLAENGFTIDGNPYGRTFQFDELKPIIGGYTAMISELEQWSEELFALAGKMRIIARNGVGLDNIDLLAAKKAGVCITYAKGINAVSVANMAIGLMLASLKKIPYFDRTTKQGLWNNDMGQDLDGKSIGFLGFGQIAQETAKRLSGFQVNMMAFDKYQPEEVFLGTGVKKVDFDTVLASCNIISLHLPYNRDTHHIIAKKELDIMKPDTILINTARGKLISSRDLYQTLKSGGIAAAGIDVYEREPIDPQDSFLTLQNVICTPHVSGHTVNSCENVGYQLAKDIVAFFNGEEPELMVQ